MILILVYNNLNSWLSKSNWFWSKKSFFLLFFFFSKLCIFLVQTRQWSLIFFCDLKKLKKNALKICSEILFFLPKSAHMGQTEQFIFQNVAYRATLQRVPTLCPFWDLGKTVLHETRVSKTVGGPLLKQKSPTCMYIHKPKTEVVETVLVIFV